MIELVTQAAWFLAAAFALSLANVLYLATAKAGTSPQDSKRRFGKGSIAFYGVAVVVIGLLFTGFEWTPWVGLIFSAALIVAQVGMYNPKITTERERRESRVVDWLELAFTGLVFVAAALLLYQVLGVTLEP